MGRLFGPHVYLVLGSILCVGPAVWILSTFISRHLTLRWYLWFCFSGNNDELGSSNRSVFLLLFNWGSSTTIVVMLASVPPQSTKSTAECSGTLLLFMGSIPWVPLSIYVVPGNIVPARFWTISNRVRARRSPICTTKRITPWNLMTTFVAVLNSGDSKRSMQHFNVVFKIILII